MAIKLTRYTSKTELVKHYTLSSDGTITKTPAPPLARGKQQTIDIDSIAELENVIGNLSSSQCLGYGVFDRLDCPIAPNSSNEVYSGYAASRTRDNVSWPTGGGVLFLDFDGKYSAADMPQLRAMICAAMPALTTAPQLWTHSNSGCLVVDGVQQAGGIHAYLLIDDAAAAPRIGQLLFDRLWLNGHGRYEVGKAQLLNRTLIDGAVWQPERIDYAALPSVGAGLELTTKPIISRFNDAEAPLHCAAIADLTDDEQQQLQQLQRSAKEAAAPQLQAERKAHIESLPVEQRKAAEARFYGADTGELQPDHILQLKGGAMVTVSEVLKYPQQYHGQECADPIDGGITNKAKIYSDQMVPVIHSFAHGGRLFRLLAEPVNIDLLCTVSDSEIISASYRSRSGASSGGVGAVTLEQVAAYAAAETGADVGRCERVWRDHIASKVIALHQSAEVTNSYDTFSAALEAIGSQSVCIQAPLGTGKTSAFAAPLIKQSIAANRPVVTVTVLRSLVQRHSEAFGTVHYKDGNEIAFANNCSVTLQTLSQSDEALRGRWGDIAEIWDGACKPGGLIVIDEAAAVADQLFGDASTLSDEQQIITIGRLKAAAVSGAQIVLLDGDITPALSVLLNALQVPVCRITEQPYPEPEVVISVEQQQQQLALDAAIIALHNGERVVIATDGREMAARLETTIRAAAPDCKMLMLNSDNTHEPQQAQFLSDPNQYAPDYQCVVYSPVLSAGFSVTSVEARVIVLAGSGVLGAAGLWQFARRWRRAIGNQIQVIFRNNARFPKVASAWNGAELWRQSVRHAARIGRAVDVYAEGALSVKYAIALYDASPIDCFAGHLINCGITTTIAGEMQSSKGNYSRDEVRAKEVDSVLNADDDIIEQYKKELDRGRPLQALEATAHTVPFKRALQNIEIQMRLCLERDELDSDTIEQALYHRLMPRAERLAELIANGDADAGASNSYAHMDRSHARAEIVRGMVDAFADGYTVSAGRVYLDTVRSQIKPLLGFGKAPTKRASGAKITRFYRDILESYGYELDGAGYVGKQRVYMLQKSTAVAPFSERILLKNYFSKTAPKPLNGKGKSLPHLNDNFIYNLGASAVTESTAKAGRNSVECVA